jgi:Bax protein
MKKIIALIFLISTISTSLISCVNERVVTSKDLDMSNLKDTNDKKRRFFNFMRPIINAENAKVLALREKLISAKKSDANHYLIVKTADNYSVDWHGTSDNWKKLLERVDAVALEVALAQSANESAWGQSRFAKQGNNFFGQWCYKKGCGIIPEKSDAGSQHEVTTFKSVNASVRSYIKNINTGRVYAPLRIVRRKNRAQGKVANAYNQAGGLIKYSQRREAYVKEIQSIIRENKKLMNAPDK